MKNAKRRFLSFLIVWILALSLFPGQALAAEAIDPARSVRITLHYAYNGKAISGAEFGIYYIASVSPYGEFALAGDFKKYPVKLEGLDAEGWNILAQTLYGYAQRDNLPQLDRGVTDSSGTLSFPTSSAQMKPGLYLVAGKTVTIGNNSYSTAPFIVRAPMEDSQKNVWNYDVTVNPKADCKENPDTPGGTVIRKVLKIWEDQGHETERPAEIYVQLLKDGKVYETVTLNKNNNWRYTWADLDARYEWIVTEREPAGYTVKTERSGVTYVITNTYSPKTPTGDTVSRKVQKVWDDKGYENQRPQNITVTLLKNGNVYDTRQLTAAMNWEYRWDGLPRYDENGKEIEWSIREGNVSGYTGSITQNGDTWILKNSINQRRLPQTGELWWPVPLLTVVGIAFLLAGGIMKKREADQ